MTIGVIIPFFQKKAGLLETALRSVVAQTIAEPIHVVVVDDASPVPAADEITRVAARAGVTFELIRQSNGGPAAARNRGLDALGHTIERVAFLDSDDEWTQDHLAHAIAALDAGGDFFFSDHYQAGQTVSAFARRGRLDPAHHPALGSTSNLHFYVGDMFDQIINGNVIGTSTVVYDVDRFRSIRFDEAFYSAGEDYLFWIACARHGARFAFSTDVEVRYGFGTNIYSGSGWGTEGHLSRIHNEMRYRKRLLEFDLNAAQRTSIEGKIAVLRNDFANDLLRRLVRRMPMRLDIVKAQFALDAKSVLGLPFAMGQIVADRIKGKIRSAQPLE